jgi:hypothetical protein
MKKMKMLKKIRLELIFFQIIIMCLSCQEKKTNLTSIFDVEYSINHNVIEFHRDDYLSNVGGMCMSRNYLIIKDKGKDTWLTIYDTETERMVKRLIRFGNGPFEMFSPPQNIAITQPNQISYLDVQTKKLYLLDFTELDSVRISQQIDLVKSTTFFMGIIPMANDYFVGMGMIDKGRYAVLDSNSNILSYNFDYPIDGSSQTSFAHKALAYQGEMVRNNDGTKFFYFSKYSEIIEIIEIDNSGNLIKIKDIHYDKAEYVPEKEGNSISSAIKKESKRAFLAACATEKYIYLLYSGKIIGENMLSYDEGKIAFVFDWNGNPIKRYNLDIEVKYIAVSDDDKTLYAIAEQEDTNLVKFKLNH